MEVRHITDTESKSKMLDSHQRVENGVMVAVETELYFTLNELAGIVNCSTEHLRRLARRGVLTVNKFKKPYTVYLPLAMKELGFNNYSIEVVTDAESV